jgi:hypothetical protein
MLMSNGDKVNIKVVVLNEIYNFAVKQSFHLRLFWVSNVQYKIQKYVVERIALAI